jgi:IS30 family transposase
VQDVLGANIYLMKKQGYNQTFITNSMGRSNSTISRELSRNTGNRGYRHKQANNLANVEIVIIIICTFQL